MESNILRVDFQTGKKIKERPIVKPDFHKELAILEKKIENKEGSKKIKRFIVMMRTLEEIKKSILISKKSQSQRKVEAQRKLLSHMSLENICDEIIGSDAEKWKRNPEFYQAVSEWLTDEKLTSMLFLAIKTLPPEKN